MALHEENWLDVGAFSETWYSLSDYAEGRIFAQLIRGLHARQSQIGISLTDIYFLGSNPTDASVGATVDANVCNFAWVAIHDIADALYLTSLASYVNGSCQRYDWVDEDQDTDHTTLTATAAFIKTSAIAAIVAKDGREWGAKVESLRDLIDNMRWQYFDGWGSGENYFFIVKAKWEYATNIVNEGFAHHQDEHNLYDDGLFVHWAMDIQGDNAYPGDSATGSNPCVSTAVQQTSLGLFMENRFNAAQFYIDGDSHFNVMTQRYNPAFLPDYCEEADLFKYDGWSCTRSSAMTSTLHNTIIVDDRAAMSALGVTVTPSGTMDLSGYSEVTDGAPFDWEYDVVPASSFSWSLASDHMEQTVTLTMNDSGVAAGTFAHDGTWWHPSFVERTATVIPTWKPNYGYWAIVRTWLDDCGVERLRDTWDYWWGAPDGSIVELPYNEILWAPGP